jgi:hypothetical protein
MQSRECVTSSQEGVTSSRDFATHSLECVMQSREFVTPSRDVVRQSRGEKMDSPAAVRRSPAVMAPDRLVASHFGSAAARPGFAVARRPLAGPAVRDDEDTAVDELLERPVARAAVRLIAERRAKVMAVKTSGTTPSAFVPSAKSCHAARRAVACGLRVLRVSCCAPADAEPSHLGDEHRGDHGPDPRRELSSVLVDSNVILDVVTGDPQWGDWSSSMLARCADGGMLVINPIIYAEVSIGFERIENSCSGGNRGRPRRSRT